MQEVQRNLRRVHPEPGRERGRRAGRSRECRWASQASFRREAWSREKTLAKCLTEHCFLGMLLFISQNTGLMVK